MGLRPWGLFKKTFYAAEGGVVPFTTRISLAKAKAQVGAEETVAGGAFSWNLALLLPPSAAMWLFLLATRWRYSGTEGAERLRKLEAEPMGSVFLDFLGWRVTAHLGPYQVPNMAHARLHEEPLRLLCQDLLLDQERGRALGRLGQLSQRRLAAMSLAPPGEGSRSRHGSTPAQLRALEPVLVSNLVLQEDAKMASVTASSNAAAASRVFLDVVAATPPEERVVPSWVVSNLVTAKGEPWGSGPQGEELRATLLLQLLRAPANCEMAASLPEVCQYLQKGGIKSNEDTLWPIKAYLLGGETSDLLRRSARLVSRQCPGAVDVPLRRGKRETPNLKTKRDLRNGWTTVLLTTGWAGFRAWRGVFDRQAVMAMTSAIGGALAGMGVLEGVWHAEENVIQSGWYYADSSLMLGCSAGMCLLNCATWAWAFQYSIAVPFLVCRLIKDDMMDAYRSFGT